MFPKSLTIVLFCLASIAAGMAASVPSRTAELAARATAAAECDVHSAVPFFRSWGAAGHDHFYTTNYLEMKDALSVLNMTYQGNMGLILRLPTISTTTLYRVFSLQHTDHFYTTNQTEADNAIKESLEYMTEGLAGYVFETQVCGSVPLYRLYDGSIVDHFYTTSETERESALKNGYSDQGIACYVLPAL